MRFASITLAVLTLTLPALGQETSPIANTWIDSVSRSGPASPEPLGEVKQVYNGSIGGHELILEQTVLADIAGKLGTEVHQWGEAGDAVAWACLARDAETLWLYSDGEMGEGKVTGVGLDMRDPAPASAGCGAWPADLQVEIGMMGVGLPADVIVANYLTGQPDDYGWFRSANLTRAADSPLETWQELTFRAKDDGTVDAMAVMQQTGY
jgi:hypothetical protein